MSFLDEALDKHKDREHFESPESKIRGCQAMIDQMQRMIKENYRQIDLGDDVEARKRMIQHLENSISENEAKIKEFQKEIATEDTKTEEE